jgi:hypothetical protein
MNKSDKNMTSSLRCESRLYRALSASVRKGFFRRLSENYPSIFCSRRREFDEDTVLGYEASWVGIARQIRQNKGTH